MDPVYKVPNVMLNLLGGKASFCKVQSLQTAEVCGGNEQSAW